MSLPVTPKVPFGGDYNPERWPEPGWDDDRLFERAAIDTVTRPRRSPDPRPRWAALTPIWVAGVPACRSALRCSG
ncbi:hypothetical protein Van01_30980 [Micromonospora andamanensis]|uniref:Uncharacterized protein n=1 Tax=Micromonospora andamanensis TaxID=1287068 RepID=A0ABQ4HW64_9ACTN|nr:hypothetical protein Van01_30980 [Micromonospora andamanensis]